MPEVFKVVEKGVLNRLWPVSRRICRRERTGGSAMAGRARSVGYDVVAAIGTTCDDVGRVRTVRGWR